jgi:hypothetical protein
VALRASYEQRSLVEPRLIGIGKGKIPHIIQRTCENADRNPELQMT